MAKIFYYCYDQQRPTGGQKHTYQHVDILNSNGFEAYALHRGPGFRLSWFENETRVIDEAAFRKLYDPNADFIVLPEDLGLGINNYPGRKVIFNKGMYLGFGSLARTIQQDPCLSSNVAAIFTVSKHNKRHLEFAYPGKTIILIEYDIRLDVFKPKSLSQKKLLIACLPKQPLQIAALMQMLKARMQAGFLKANRLHWAFIREMSERQVANLLSDALIFVFLSTEEGLPRMPLEAMASGCLIVAPRCPPLTEYLPRELSFSQGDLVGMAQFIEKIVSAYPNNIDRFSYLTKKGRRIAAKFSPRRQERSVLRAWEIIFRTTSTTGVPNSAWRNA